mmetsp:Transcript_50193/g.155072  ORF Transcript_50193/g.155072 Transcript_50193/m.155072 type:complete len:419 (+) Transcript_50193:1612-2868(+)
MDRLEKLDGCCRVQGPVRPRRLRQHVGHPEQPRGGVRLHQLLQGKHQLHDAPPARLLHVPGVPRGVHQARPPRALRPRVAAQAATRYRHGDRPAVARLQRIHDGAQRQHPHGGRGGSAPPRRAPHPRLHRHRHRLRRREPAALAHAGLLQLHPAQRDELRQVPEGHDRVAPRRHRRLDRQLRHRRLAHRAAAPDAPEHDVPPVRGLRHDGAPGVPQRDARRRQPRRRRRPSHLRPAARVQLLRGGGRQHEPERARVRYAVPEPDVRASSRRRRRLGDIRRLGADRSCGPRGPLPAFVGVRRHGVHGQREPAGAHHLQDEALVHHHLDPPRDDALCGALPRRLRRRHWPQRVLLHELRRPWEDSPRGRRRHRCCLVPAGLLRLLGRRVAFEAHARDQQDPFDSRLRRLALRVHSRDRSR